MNHLPVGFYNYLPTGVGNGSLVEKVVGDFVGV